MKIIDQTPFYNHETGEISMMDRGRAILQYGTNWVKEVEGQQEVIALLAKILDRNFTLLRNVIPAGMDTRFPLILVGPPGVYVLFVTPLTGIYRAKGDQWGTISGNSFKPERPNLLTRTERMARAIQVFLQRHGYTAMLNVDPVLLCSDPSFSIDSVRPIIRVVMRDALERFAISLAQARITLSPESVQDIVQRLLNPPLPDPSPPAETREEAPPEVEEPFAGDIPLPAAEMPTPEPPRWVDENEPLPEEAQRRPSGRMTRMQWGVLIAIFLVWCLLVGFFVFLVLQTYNFIP